MDSQTMDRKQSKTRFFLMVFITCLGIGTIVYLFWPYIRVMSEPEEARRLITEAGGWGPAVFILMQILQVLIAPLPGQVMGLVGGYLFGPVWGLIYTVVGATIGFTLVFILARKLGRPFVERIISKKSLDRFDHLTRDKGVLVFFLIFLLPAFPDDIVSFIAGLSPIRIRTLVLISLAGRLPGYIVLCLTGNGLTYDNLNPVIAGIAGILIFLVMAWRHRAWLHQFVEHKDRVAFLKEQWNASKVKIVIWSFVLLAAAIVLIRIGTIVPVRPIP